MVRRARALQVSARAAEWLGWFLLLCRVGQNRLIYLMFAAAVYCPLHQKSYMRQDFSTVRRFTSKRVVQGCSATPNYVVVDSAWPPYGG